METRILVVGNVPSHMLADIDDRVSNLPARSKITHVPVTAGVFRLQEDDVAAFAGVDLATAQALAILDEASDYGDLEDETFKWIMRELGQIAAIAISDQDWEQAEKADLRLYNALLERNPDLLVFLIRPEAGGWIEERGDGYAVGLSA